MLGPEPAEELFQGGGRRDFVRDDEEEVASFDGTRHVVQLVLDPAGRSVQARAGIDVPEEPFQVGFAGLRGEGCRCRKSHR